MNMDDNRVEEEVSSCGIFKQSIKVISQWKLIFFQITLALIVPLSLTILLRAHISKYLIDSYMSVESFLFDPATNTTTYYTATQVNNPNDKLMDKLSIYFEIGYFTFLIVFSLLSTSAIVYTIACIYSAKEITFRKVISVVSKVWKRLLLTFLIGYVTLLAIAFLGFFLWMIVLSNIYNAPIDITLSVLILIVFGSSFGYVYIIWNMASVVSVLEEINVFQSIKKSKVLIKGHLGVSILLFVLQTVVFAGLSIWYQVLIMDDDLKLGIKIIVGELCFDVLVIGFLLVLVIQTVIYFVCKSYHHEIVDKTCLADHLEATYGGYVQLNGPKELQLQSL